MNSTNHVVKVESQEFSREKINLIRRICAKDATDDEFMQFLEYCRVYQLNPLLKEIYFVKSKAGKPNIFASRDGYLKIAHLSGQLDGIESRVIEDDNGKPYKAVCTVWRKDMSRPFIAEVKFSEHFNPKTDAWMKYPSAMLIKVAEVFALRRAFAITGLVTREECSSEVEFKEVEFKEVEFKEVESKEVESKTTDSVKVEPVNGFVQTKSVSVPEPVVVCTSVTGSDDSDRSGKSRAMTIEQKETLLRTIVRLHKRRRERALQKLSTFDFDAASKAISDLERLDFINDNEVSRILDLSRRCGLGEDGLQLFLKARYDIGDVRDITRDILNEVLREISKLCNE